MATTCHLNQVLFISLFLFIPILSQGLMKTADNFGPYTPTWRNVTACQGPKAKNLANFTTHLVIEENCYKSVLNFSFPSNALMEEVKMEVYTLKNNKKNVLWSYRVNKPCQHYAIEDILEKTFRVHGCLFKKGDHIFIINLTEAVQQYLGPTFFYGEFIFKMNVYNKKGNLACLLFNPVFIKKT